MAAKFILLILPVLLLFALTCEANNSPRDVVWGGGGEDGVGGGGDFVGRRGTQFVVADEKPFLFNGFNSYWMMHVAANPAQRKKVTEVLRDSAAAGLTVCRTWAFADGGSGKPLQVSPGVYDNEVFEGLDFVVSEARRYGVRLILSLVNNYKAYGGKAQYVQWASQAAGVHDAISEDDFYINPVIKGYYKNHVKKVLRRINTFTQIAYKDDPTIMAWELINEPRCKADTSGKTVHVWVQEMAKYIKSIDNKHMVEIGMEGFYGDSLPERLQYNPHPSHLVGTDYIMSNLIKEIDFATIHGYPDIWLSKKNDSSQILFVRRWLLSHWEDASEIIKKPLVFAEFGKSRRNPLAGSNEDVQNTFINIVYKDIYRYAAMGGGSMAGGMVWQIMAEGMENYYDGYEIVLPQNPSTAAVLMRQSQLMMELAHSLAGGGLPAPASGLQMLTGRPRKVAVVGGGASE